MEHVENTWQGLEDFLQTAPARDLDIDCTAVGIASVKGPTVHFKEILFLEGEIHEDPETLQSHCASLVALWAAVKAPSLIDLGQCSCIGRRLLLQEPTLGRRFAIHATEINDSTLLFAVISSTKRWKDVETVKCLITELVALADHVSDKNDLRAEETEAQQDTGLNWYQFTSREVDILKLVAAGHSNKQIARELGSSPNTVRNQIHALFRKAEVTNRTELALRVAAAT